MIARNWIRQKEERLMIRYTFETERFPAEAREAVLAFFSESYRLKRLTQTANALSFQTACTVPLMRRTCLPRVVMRFEETATGTRIYSSFSFNVADRIFLILFVAVAVVIEIAMLLAGGFSSPLYLAVPSVMTVLALLLACGNLYLCVRRLIRKLNQEL